MNLVLPVVLVHIIESVKQVTVIMEVVLMYFCDMTLATGADTTVTEYSRLDQYYTLAGTISTESRDCGFNGTSSACPISVGLMATKLEYNRDWTCFDMKGWLGTLGSWEITDLMEYLRYTVVVRSPQIITTLVLLMHIISREVKPYHLGCTNWRRTRVFKIS